MLYGRSIIDMGDNGVAFMNSYGLSEMIGLMDKIIQHMAEDLEYATGVPKDVMINNYIYINDFDPIREVLKKQGKWNEDMDKSLVSIVMERKFNKMKGMV